MTDWAPKTPAASALQAAPGHWPGPSPGTSSPADCLVSGLSPQGGAQSAWDGPAPTETVAVPADAPSPAGALERAFGQVLQRQMRDVPMINPALAVEAVGFRPWSDHWLGILITPWFMNLVLMPRVASRWQALAEGDSRHYVFPAGVFEFIGARQSSLGDYQTCSLFSPMFEFGNAAGARDTAVAALDALFDEAHRSIGSAPTPDPTTPGAAPAPSGRALSKRSFLFGTQPRADDGR